MEQAKMTQFLSQKRDFLFDNNEYDQEIISALISVEDDCFSVLDSLPLRNPSLIQVLAIAPGAIDRLLLGEYAKVILKNFTIGGLGIWWIKDILSAKSRCREYNRKRLLKAINDPSVAKKIISAEEKAKMAFAFTKEVAPTVMKGAKDIRDTFSYK